MSIRALRQVPCRNHRLHNVSMTGGESGGLGWTAVNETERIVIPSVREFRASAREPARSPVPRD